MKEALSLFVNAFDFKGMDRFYTTKAHKAGELRGWIGHQLDQKWLIALSGTVLIAVLAPDDWEKSSRDLPVQRFTFDCTETSNSSRSTRPRHLQYNAFRICLVGCVFFGEN